MKITSMLNTPIVDLMAMTGISRETAQGGCPSKSGAVQPSYRTCVERSTGRQFDFPADEAARFSIALLRLRGF
jgi:hypothetical protein